LAAALVFALLVGASVGAFFLTTRLKRSTPVVQQLSFNRYLSPNGDGRNDSVRISLRTKRRDEVTVAVVDRDGEEVRVLARDRELDRGRYAFRWDGLVAGTVPAPDGEYRIRVGLRRQGRTITSPRKLFVDTQPPSPNVRYVSPDSISPDGTGSANSARLRFDGPARVAPRLLVYRTDLEGRPPLLVARRTGTAGEHELSWDGLVGEPGHERPASPGSYVLVPRVRDAAGNVGPALPPVRGRPSGHPGLIVSYASVHAPLEPVRAGEVAHFAVASDGRRYRWRLQRLGAPRSRKRGASRSESLAVGIPDGRRSSVWLLDVRVGGHRVESPFAVQGGARAPVLVVLPAATWQATNPLDSDGDGFPDTLAQQREVSLERPFARGLPAGFDRAESPLLRFLDGEGLRYDLTTDLALTAPDAPPPVRYRGLLFAAAPVYFPRTVGRLVRSYVEAGGRVAWLGTGGRSPESGGFTLPVVATGERLVRGARRARAVNLFGERLQPGRPPGPLTVLGDRIGFFSGVGGSFGPFPRLEEGRRLPRGARLLASAAREAGRPSLIVYRSGKGVVARIGVDGFALTAAGSPDVARIMRRLWTLLSR
jgi:hypothetical protein